MKMVSDNSQAIPRLEATLRMPGKQAMPDYGAFREERLIKDFVTLFNEVIPPQTYDEEQAAALVTEGGSDQAKRLPLGESNHALEFSYRTFGFLSIERSVGGHALSSIVVAHTRTLVVPAIIEAKASHAGAEEPVPVTFRTVEETMQNHVIQRDLGMSYGKDGRLGTAQMVFVESKRAWGVGIETMKGVDLSQAETVETTKATAT